VMTNLRATWQTYRVGVVVVGRMVWYTARDMETRKDLHHGYHNHDMPSLRQFNAP
jgi:hypothetical protein